MRRGLVVGFCSLAGAAVFLAVGLAIAATVRTDGGEYEFQLVEREIRHGGGAAVAVRLVHRPTGKIIPDAVIFARHMDMSPDGMVDMTAPLELLPDSLPSYYRFATDLLMEGKWALSLVAKVSDDTDAVQDRLIVNAVQ